MQALSGREYQRVMGYKLEDAEYVIIVGQGSVICNAEVVSLITCAKNAT